MRGSVTKTQIDNDPRILLLVDRKNYIKHFCDEMLGILGDENRKKHAYISKLKQSIVEFYNDISNGVADVIRQNYFNPQHPKDDAGVTMVGVYTSTGNKLGVRILADIAEVVKGNERKARRFTDEVAK